MKRPTRLVVDINCLQSPELDDFLSGSRDHIAVLTDYAGMEIYKARVDTAVRDSISVLARFPCQVLVLKSTTVVCGLRGRQAGLSRRLIDNEQTRQFQLFCDAARKVADGDERYRAAMNHKRQEARDHLSKVARKMSRMTSHYAKFESLFTASEIRKIRTNKPIDLSAWEKLFGLITELAGQLHNEHPCTNRWPSPEEWPNTFLYRSTLFQGLHFFDWIRGGSPSKLSTETILNDMVDMNFGTYATYFDGLLTRDQKSLSIYNEARFVLETFLLPMTRAAALRS